MKPRFETITEKRFVGKRISMSFSDNKTKALWQSFMSRRGEVKNNIGTGLYSLEMYPPHFFVHFDPGVEFEKWAAIEVHDLDTVPEGMETLAVPEGLYAVFLYKGLASSAPEAYQYIFGTWLPNSDYVLDNRPHFAVMGEKYKNNEPSSEEELWIPIK
jgi:AraC family transcriptional regulator